MALLPKPLLCTNLRMGLHAGTIRDQIALHRVYDDVCQSVRHPASEAHDMCVAPHLQENWP